MKTTDRADFPSGDLDDFEIKRLMFTLPFKVNRVLRSYLSGPCLELGVKEYQVPTLNIIYYYDGISQKGIKSLLPFDKSRISVVVNELISAGMVKNSGEGRTSSLHLTGKGMDVAVRLSASVDKLFERVCAPLSDEEKAIAEDIHIRISRGLDELIGNFCDESDSE